MTPMDAIWLVLMKMYPLPVTSWLPTHSPPCRSVTGIGYTSKNLSKWQEIQLAIHPIVGG